MTAAAATRTSVIASLASALALQRRLVVAERYFVSLSFLIRQGHGIYLDLKGTPSGGLAYSIL